MAYFDPRVPEKEIRLCFELFDKEEAIKRVIEFIKNNNELAKFQYQLLEKSIELNNNLTKQ